jgi:hypothetical protein
MIQTSIVIPNKKALMLQANKRSMLQMSGSSSISDQYQQNILSSHETMIKRAKFAQSRIHADPTSDHSTLYEDEDDAYITSNNKLAISNLGINVPNLAPDVDSYSETSITSSVTSVTREHDMFRQHHLELINRQFQQQYHQSFYDENEAEDTSEEGMARKKKYAKEAWPGRKPGSEPTIVQPHAGSSLAAVKSPPKDSSLAEKKLQPSPNAPSAPSPNVSKPNLPGGESSKRLLI